MSKLAGNTRAALLGVLFAMVGFSYAIATVTGDVASGPAADRAVGTNPLHFTNPFYTATTDRDLGDIIAGSGFVRYVRAAGGVAPYTFVSSGGTTAKPLTALSSVAALNGSLLLSSGTLIGTSIKTASGSPFRFQVTVSDSSTSNASKTDFFRLTLVTGNTFRFAVDSLPSGVQFQDYVAKLDVLNGIAPYSFSVSAADQTTLSGFGLAIGATDGTIYGKPLKAGSVTFTAIAKDSKGASALGRSPSTTANQSFTVTIEANDTVSATSFATGISIKASAAGKDSISYAGVANLNGKSVSSLAGSAVVLRIGQYTSPNTTATPATLDDKGKTVKAPKAPAKTTVVTLKGSISTKGQVKITVGKEDIKALFAGSDTYAVSLQVGSAVISNEVLNFTRKTSSNGYSLTYKYGSNFNLAGGLLLTSVTGKDDAKAATDFDSWKVAFLAQGAAVSATAPVGGLDGTNSATVLIGNAFSDDVGMSFTKGSVKSTDKKGTTDPEVTKLSVNKGKGSLQTGFIPGSSTGIKSAKAATVPANFTLGIVLKAGTTKVFSGEGGSVIFDKSGKSWTSQNPVK